MKKEELSKIHRNEEELLVKTTELDCLKRELQEKTNELNKEREKLESSIRSEQVSFYTIYISFFKDFMIKIFVLRA